MGKAKITFESDGDLLNGVIEFTTWNQRPMQPQQKIDYTTRLGGSQLIISKINVSSPVSSVTATLTSNLDDYSSAFDAVNSKITLLSENIGKRFTWTDENGIVQERCYIVDFTSYNIQRIDGGAKVIATLNFQVATDKE